MKLLKLIFLVCFFAQAGCQKSAQPPPVRLYLSYIGEVSPTFQTKILNAINAINLDAGAEIVSFHPVDNGKPLSILNMQSNSIFAHAQYLDYHCKIEIDESNSTVNNQDPDQTDLKYILTHEIGHCYGYQHSSDPSKVMYADYVGVQYKSPAQVTQTKNMIHSFLLELKTLL